MPSYLHSIDIPEARKTVQQCIDAYARRAALYRAIIAFFEALPAKKINASVAGKLHETLVENHPKLKVARIAWAAEKTTQHAVRGELTIWAYETRDTDRVTVLQNLDLSFDTSLWHKVVEVEDMHVAHLKKVFAGFAGHAQKFNEALEVLRKAAAIAVPKGKGSPIYPLSEMFGWNSLAGMPTADEIAASSQGAPAPDPAAAPAAAPAADPAEPSA